MMMLCGLVVLFCMAVILTGMVRYYAVKKAILDIPNDRSSHKIPTPRGGGLVFVSIFLLAVFYLWVQGALAKDFSLALLGGGMLTAYIGYYDDIRKLKAKWRALAHLLAAIWVVYCLHGFPEFDLGSVHVYTHWVGIGFAILAVVWGVNLYNFMDGVDGFATTQGIMTSLIVAWFFWTSRNEGLVILNLILAVALSGFLCWNWPPAKIFMGDVGSGFLGFVFATMALYSVNQHILNLVIWAIILSIYIYDATLTLIYRLCRKQAWYEAHRDHAYQQWIIVGLTHWQITFGLILLNGFVFFPAAIVVYYHSQLALWVLGGVSLVQVILWGYAGFYLRAKNKCLA